MGILYAQQFDCVNKKWTAFCRFQKNTQTACFERYYSQILLVKMSKFVLSKPTCSIDHFFENIFVNHFYAKLKCLLIF